MNPVENVLSRMTDWENKPSLPHELFENFRILPDGEIGIRKTFLQGIVPEDISSVFKASEKDQEHTCRFLDPISEVEYFTAARQPLYGQQPRRRRSVLVKISNLPLEIWDGLN